MSLQSNIWKFNVHEFSILATWQPSYAYSSGKGLMQWSWHAETEVEKFFNNESIQTDSMREKREEVKLLQDERADCLDMTWDAANVRLRLEGSSSFRPYQKRSFKTFTDDDVA